MNAAAEAGPAHSTSRDIDDAVGQAMAEQDHRTRSRKR